MSQSNYARLSVSAKSNDIVSYLPVKFTYIRDTFFRDFLTGKLQPEAKLYVAQVNQKRSKDGFNFLKGDTMLLVDEGMESIFTASMPHLDEKCGRKSLQGVVKAADVVLKKRINWSAEEVCEYVIEPMCMEGELFYSDLIRKVDARLVNKLDYGGTEGKREVTAAFVSYARSMKFTDWVNALETFFKSPSNNLDVDTVFIWSELFCANQARLARPDTLSHHIDSLTTGLQMAIQRFEHKVLIFDVWNDPAPLKRAWCIWEILGVALSEGATLEIAMTEAEKDKYLTALMDADKYNKILQSILDIDAKESECFNATDKAMIFQAIEEQSSFYHVNEVVRGKLRQWHAQTAHQEVDRRRRLGLLDDEFALLLSNLGQLLQDQGKIEAAEPVIREALELGKAALTPDDTRIASRLNNLASLITSRGSNLKEGEALEREALSIVKDKLGVNHPTYALYLSNLGLIRMEQCEYEDALAMFSEALRIDRASSDGSQAVIGSDLNNMALTLRIMGRYKDAEPFQRESIQISEMIKGKNHPTTATRLSNLALLLQDQGRLEEAELLMNDALRIVENAYGKESHSYAWTLNHLSRVLLQQCKFKDAFSSMYEALAIERRVSGNEHPDYLRQLNNVASVLRQEDELDEALSLYYEALAIEKKVYATPRPRYAVLLNNIAQVLQDQEKLEGAEKLMRQALEISKETLDPEHPAVASTLNNLAQLLFQKDNSSREAADLGRQALVIAEARLGLDHPRTRAYRRDWG